MMTQQLKHLSYSVPEGLLTILQSSDFKNCTYAFIIHDKDESEFTETGVIEPHVHLYLEFKNPRSLQSIAKKLDVNERYIELFDKKQKDGRNANGFLYLIHQTRGAIEEKKHPYDPNDVISNMNNFPAFVEEAVEKMSNLSNSKNKTILTKQKIEHLLDSLGNYQVTLNEVEALLTGSEYARYSHQLKDAHALGLRKKTKDFECLFQQGKIKKEIIWLFGPTGLGKTRLAIDYATKILDSNEFQKINTTKGYYIAGNRDPFQEYTGEPVVILDDLRPETFSYQELLKILDPHHSTYASSRYHDKSVIALKIIITTPLHPQIFYNHFKNLHIQDSYQQLARRISTVCQFDKDQIKTYASTIDLNSGLNYTMMKNKYAQDTQSSEVQFKHESFINFLNEVEPITEKQSTEERDL